MATQDGYVAYPTNLTAEQIVFSLNRAWDLSNELENYIYRTISTTKPTDPKFGDFYSDEDKCYRAWVEGNNVLWIEE